ncbi:MAG: SGNH/GDSL hydrolase family protein [Rhodospirillales bacterium]|nr:SGNH/GDSL hydrolase family protein [Rhodospirillales bacterium]
MKTMFKNILLMAVSVLVTLVMLEGASRLVMPVKYGNEVMALDGSALPPYEGDEMLRPGLSYRVVSQEFDTVVTHTPSGYRGLSEPVNPEVVFIGDSFTYGVGLQDKETIPHIYCRELDLVCVNLGVPGTATIRQLDRLERYLQEKNWRPREVKLLFMGMTAALLAGNDLNGNLEELPKEDVPVAAEAAPVVSGGGGLLAWLVGQRTFMLDHSNLVRIAYYIGGPLLRAGLSPETGDDELHRALGVTKDQFARLEALSKQYGFAYHIYIIHPMQDVINDTWENTLQALQDIAPEGAVVTSLAPAVFRDDSLPSSNYYPMDGHLNAAGAEKTALYLVGLDQPQ